MEPITWILVGSVFVFVGSVRQAWFELREYHLRLDETLHLALEIVEEDESERLQSELSDLSGARRAAKKRHINKRASAELRARERELLNHEERRLLEASTRAAVSWTFIVLGSLFLALDPVLELVP